MNLGEQSWSLGIFIQLLLEQSYDSFPPPLLLDDKRGALVSVTRELLDGVKRIMEASVPQSSISFLSLLYMINGSLQFSTNVFCPAQQENKTKNCAAFNVFLYSTYSSSQTNSPFFMLFSAKLPNFLKQFLVE